MALYKTGITKALIRLRRCPGLSAPVLLTNPWRQVFLHRGSFLTWKLVSFKPGFLFTALTQIWQGTSLGLMPLTSCVNFSIPASLSFQLEFSSCPRTSAVSRSVAFSRNSSSWWGRLKVQCSPFIMPSLGSTEMDHVRREMGQFYKGIIEKWSFLIIPL